MKENICALALKTALPKNFKNINDQNSEIHFQKFIFGVEAISF